MIDLLGLDGSDKEKKMTRYKRHATRNETMQGLIAEVRALRAEVAYLSASRVQIVPMPYPVYPQPAPFTPYYPPLQPVYGTITGDTSGNLIPGLSTSNATNVIAYHAGD